jgi:hypothetical protein
MPRRSGRKVRTMPPADDAQVAAVAATVPETPSTPKVIEPIPIVLGGRERTLRMDFKAMKRFHNATGLSPWAREVWDDPSPEMLVALLWAALTHEDPDLTLEDVETMDGVEMGNIAYLSSKIGDLWGKTMPDPEPVPAVRANGKTSDPNPPSSSTGTGASNNKPIIAQV